MAETWAEINDRHAMERAEAVASLRDAGFSQTQAAQKLGIPLGHLNSFIIRNGIPWTPSKQWQGKHPTPEEQSKIDYIRTLLTHHEMSVQQLRDLGYAEAAIKAAQEASK